VAVNVRNSENEIAVPETWQNQEVTNQMNSETFTLSQTLKLAPYEYLILKNNK